MFQIKKISLVVMAALAVAGCKKSFTDRASLDSTTLDNYYNTKEEVRGLTSTLYGVPWRNFEERAWDAVGDVMGGNELATYDANYGPFSNFTFSANSTAIADAWASLYKIGGWTSEYVNALQLKLQKGGNPDFINPAIAECHFFKGVVYFYAARMWGDAPIINQPGETILGGNFNIPRYYQEDVLRFALNEFKAAETGLPTTDEPGRVTSWAAKGMMAKLYLYRGVYDSAKIKAQEVMNSGQYDLFPDYAGLFNSAANNNNIECLFSLQHQATQNPYGSGNLKAKDRGPGSLQTSEADYYGGVFFPSIDLVRAYETGDKRKAGSLIEPGWKMPNWKPQRNGLSSYNAFMANGFVYDSTLATNDGGTANNDVNAYIAKYVVGPGKTYGGDYIDGHQSSGLNLPILRYADVLLIYAEAVLGTGASTSDGTALAALNKVRARAGLAAKVSFTKDDILHERRVEFAFEGDYWFDIQRQGFAKAKQMVEAQDRGSKWGAKFVTFNQSFLYLPIPAGEVLQDPELGKPPVHYY
ncbi:MAG: RagB/SusD family nutrient uptake outer membrane protein [Bacteroidetes bacterium]|nr:RagB/SusD family nutrient uptake outer membrane protein [Bacteroidota bacterium]